VLPFGLASKLGFHPLTNAVLVAIYFLVAKSTSPPKWPHRSIAIEGCGNLQCACWIMLSMCIANNLKSFRLVLL
jgi:hypothetical protein